MTDILMRNLTDDPYGISLLQNKILEIMRYIDKICRENDIEYCLMGGSALGIKRHGGYIPWDDDLDLFMTPDNYERFREVFYQKGNRNQYHLQEWGAAAGMVKIAKLRDTDTAYIEEDLKNWKIHHGAYVDIFLLHRCPSNPILRMHQLFWAKYIVLKGLSNRHYKRRGRLISSVLGMMRLFPKRFLLKHALREVYRYRSKKTDYYCNFLGKAVYRKGIYDRKWMDHPVDMQFETMMLKAPHSLEDFLNCRFGNYLDLPSEGRIKWEQHAWKWDVERSFLSYGFDSNYSDEKYLL